MKLTLVSKPDANPAKFTYEKGPPGTEGYLYWKDGVQVSRTFNPNDLEVEFGKPFKSVDVEAVSFKSLTKATWPELPPPPNDLWTQFLEWYKTKPPKPLTPNKTATTETDARAKINGLQAGDVLRVTGVTFSYGGDGPALRLSNLPACTIEFVDCKVIHTGKTLYPTVEHERCHKDSKIYGLDITGPNANNGIRTEDSRGTWWGFKLHHCGGTGLMTVSRTVNDGPYDFRGEITNTGTRLELDPHTEKGTGVHGAYIGGSNDNAHGCTGTFVLFVHDQPYGNGTQFGSYVIDSIVAVWAERCSFNAQSQVGGNAICWWGGNLRNIRVPFLYGKELAGRMSEVDGVYSNTAQNIVHEFGRGERVCLNPRLSNVAYATGKSGFTYRDCEATYV